MSGRAGEWEVAAHEDQGTPASSAVRRPPPPAGNILGRPSWLPVPDFALTTLLGEGASVVLDVSRAAGHWEGVAEGSRSLLTPCRPCGSSAQGQRVMPTRTQAAGYRYQYADIGDALRNLVRP